MRRLLPLILFLCPLALHSQSSFLIPVQTTTGQGISGATVTLTCTDTTNGCVGKGPFSATSTNGNAAFTAIPAGNYTVAITGPNLTTFSYAYTVGSPPLGLAGATAATICGTYGVICVDGSATYPRTGAGITAAITAALTAGNAASVLLTPGSYSISGTITIASGPLVIGCMGGTGQEQASPKPCTLNWTGGASPIITISSADGTTLNNLTFDNHGTATYGIFLQNTQYAWINNVTCINPNTTFTTAFVGTATGGQANYQIHMTNPNIQATGPVGVQIDRTNIFSISHGAFINHTTANITVGLTTANTQIIIDQGTDFGQAMGGGATAMGVKVGTVNGLKIKDAYCETAQSGAQTGQLCVQFVSAAQSTATLDSNYFAGNGVSNYGMQLNGLINLTLSGVNAFSGFVTNGINNISNTSVIALGNNPVDTLNAVPVWDSLAGVAFRQDAATTGVPFTINTGLSETGTVGIGPIGTPSAPTLSGPGSSGGGTTYTYFCVAEDAGGLKTLASAQGQTTTGLATLTSINFIAVHCPGQAGAYAYDILKTDTAHRLGRVVVQYAGFGPTLNDTGQATVGFTAAGRDQTGDLNITGNVTPSNNLQMVSGSVIFTEKAQPTGGAGTDNCYGDSTAHAVKCSNNGGTFGQIPLINAAQTWTATQNFPGNIAALTADWTCGTGGTVSSCVAATIIGSGGGVPLTFTLPLVATSYTLECDGVVGQATAVTANQWNLLTATNGATNVTANYSMATAATASAYGAVTDQASTTTTFQIAPSWTLGAITTKMPFHIWAKIEGASASGTVVSLQLLAPTVGDLVTIYRGTACIVF